MKFLALLLIGAAIACAEPIKFKNATTVEGTIGKFTPATVEIVTAGGIVTAHFRELDVKWREQHMAGNPEVIALKEEDDSRTLAKEAVASAKKFQDLATALVAENQQLRGQLIAAGLTPGPGPTAPQRVAAPEPPKEPPLITQGRRNYPDPMRPDLTPSGDPKVARNGVPYSVMGEIRAKAEKEWPGDYEMQQWAIKNQVEAYKALNP